MILCELILSILLVAYFIFRIYKQKKYFSSYWVREFGPSLIAEANNGDFYKPEDADETKPNRAGVYAEVNNEQNNLESDQ